MKLNLVECRDVIEYLNDVEDNIIDLAIIDPPYNLNKGEWDKFENHESFLNFTSQYLKLVYKKLKSTGSLYIFNTAFNCVDILIICKTIGFIPKNWITWYKKDGFSYSRTKYINNQETILFFTKDEKNYCFNADDIREPYKSQERMKTAKIKGILKNGKRWFPNPNGKLCSDVWEMPSVRLTKKINGRVSKQLHPTPKPESMISRMILASSKPGDLVLDLFSGTGTTAFVSKQLNRNFIGCEDNEEYIKLIKERLELC